MSSQRFCPLPWFLMGLVGAASDPSPPDVGRALPEWRKKPHPHQISVLVFSVLVCHSRRIEANDHGFPSEWCYKHLLFLEPNLEQRGYIPKIGRRERVESTPKHPSNMSSSSSGLAVIQEAQLCMAMSTSTHSKMDLQHFKKNTYLTKNVRRAF